MYVDLHADAFLEHSMSVSWGLCVSGMYQIAWEQSKLEMVVREENRIPQREVSSHRHLLIQWFDLGS